MSKNPKIFKPGQDVPRSAQYQVVGPRGGLLNREITGVKGKTFPATPKPNMGFMKVDNTKHKRSS